MESRVELFAQIRRDARVEGLSIRELARRHEVARKTVRKALNSPVPPARKTPVRSSPRLDPFKSAIDAMLIEDTASPGSSAILLAGFSRGSSRSTERRIFRIRRCVTM